MASRFTKYFAYLTIGLIVISICSHDKFSIVSAQQAEGNAQTHSQAGFAYHLRRCLDDASREYAQALSLEPPRELTSEEWALVKRFAPRIYVTQSEFFPLKDFAVILHPQKRLIAYHLFWEDDIDFPEDNDPCDHEVMWVEYAEDRVTIKRVWTYFHNRILDSGQTAVEDAKQHGMRPRINVQWGKHGSMPAGWENLKISRDPGATSTEPISLKQYNEDLFRLMTTEGRRLANHPLGVRGNWPKKFSGNWAAFTNFPKLVEPLVLMKKNRMALASNWNNATINQYFLHYNFRPKTEWPPDEPASNNR